MLDCLNLKETYSTVVIKRKEVENNMDIKYEKKTSVPFKAVALTSPMLLTPTIAFADTFQDIYGTVMTMFDAGVVLIIIFAGASWALGHRSKAIELLIGVSCGYLLARHAVDIRDYLKSIG